MLFFYGSTPTPVQEYIFYVVMFVCLWFNNKVEWGEATHIDIPLSDGRAPILSTRARCGTWIMYWCIMIRRLQILSRWKTKRSSHCPNHLLRQYWDVGMIVVTKLHYLDCQLGGTPILGHCRGFCSDDHRFRDFRSNWAPILCLCLNPVWL